MLDYVLLVITLLFLAAQGIVSCRLCFFVARGKKAGGTVVSDFWWDGMPCFFSGRYGNYACMCDKNRGYDTIDAADCIVRVRFV